MTLIVETDQRSGCGGGSRQTIVPNI